MGFTLYLSGCALPAIGLMRALEERDIVPCSIVARASGALVGGLYSCGLNSAALERIALTLCRNSLALLRQVLPALRSECADMSPDELAAAVLGENEQHKSIPARITPAKREDGITLLLSELTDGISLRDASNGLIMPVCAYHADGSAPIGTCALNSGRDARYALSLAEALRCAAFPASIFTAPSVGGRLLGACNDDSARKLLIGARSAVCMCHSADGKVCAPHVRLEAATFNPRSGVREQIMAGYELALQHMSGILALC